jgi:hypothetical protein
MPFTEKYLHAPRLVEVAARQVKHYQVTTLDAAVAVPA